MKINQSLFEDMSAMYMQLYGFPPLTANIYTYLLFDYEHEGITFEELVETTQASKSSVSNSLNRLLESNYIEFFTKIEERKRFYRVNKSIFRIQFINQIHELKTQNEILNRFFEHRCKTVSGNDADAEKIKLHIQLQEKTIALYEQTLSSLNQLNN
ncbi:MAG: GbsR/MarR family transcriptional regulator [Weeksellaceae bacterium]